MGPRFFGRCLYYHSDLYFHCGSCWKYVWIVEPKRAKNLQFSSFTCRSQILKLGVSFKSLFNSLYVLVMSPIFLSVPFHELLKHDIFDVSSYLR